MAKCLSAFGTHGGKAQVCETFLTRANVMWCAHASCCRAYEDYHQHSGRNRAEHRESGHFTDKIMKCPKLPKSTMIYFAQEDWNFESYESKFSNFFKRALNSVPNQIPVNLQLAVAYSSFFLRPRGHRKMSTVATTYIDEAPPRPL